jgi:glyoxylase-like metal-dependent hydrolase (beta-lactamase superfamily II)/rhodanese-related sulfurtransferase
VTQPTTEIAWTAGELLNQLRRRQKLFVLDVRNRDEFEKYPLEGPGVSAINFPYFEMLEAGGKDDMVDSIVACVEQDLAGKLPKDSPILAVCAKGGTSEFVMQGLQRLGYDAGNLQGGMNAWGNYYESHAILDTHELSIFQISRPARGCLSYMVVSDGNAIVIDPLRHLHAYLDLARARGCSISTIVDTHSHADHISGARALAAATGATYHLHPYDAIHPMDLLPATFPYEPIRDGQVLRAGKHELRVVHIPGHTLGLVALILDDQYLFTGDSIFIRSIARPDLGNKAEAWAPLHTRSLRKLLELPERINALPGHFSDLAEGSAAGIFHATLADLKRNNESLVMLQRESDAGFVRYLLDSLPKFIPEYVEIKRVNTGLSSPAEDDAATLELGKNVCGLAQAQAAVRGESR